MAISKKLETIYHNGQPDGIRSIRRNLSTMTVYVIPRPLLGEAKNISDCKIPLPPLEEQNRICEAINEIFIMLEVIEQSLN